MNITVLSCSLDPDSRSRLLATASVAVIERAGHTAWLVDLRELGGVPAFDNDRAFDDPRYDTLHTAIAQADGVVVASPVYNWQLSSSTKSMIELTGATGQHGRTSAWFDKLVTFVCAGGLPQSYMAHGPTALSLMLDFKCIVNPHFVYAADDDWSKSGAPAARVLERLRRVMTITLELAERLHDRTYRSTWET